MSAVPVTLRQRRRDSARRPRKLSDDAIRDILHKDSRTESELAARYGVKQNTINRIRTGARCASIATEVPRWHRYIVASSLSEVLALQTCTDQATGCVNWTGALMSTGYGQFSFRGRKYLAHRVAYEFAKGQIPDGLVVMHACDNPRCCNPEHLSVGTDQDNRNDCVAKARHVYGETHPTAKLKAVEVLAIRADTRSQRTIAEDFGISQRQVSTIKTHSQWRSLP